MPVIEIEGLKADTAELYFIKSTANPTAVFRSNNHDVFGKIFVSKKKFKK